MTPGDAFLLDPGYRWLAIAAAIALAALTLHTTRKDRTNDQERKP